MRLVKNRSVHLCGIIARKPYVSKNAKLYGLPLGHPLSSSSENERNQKSLIIVGIKNAKGDLADASTQKKMVAELIRGGKIAKLSLSNYSEVASGKELRYIEAKPGAASKKKPVKAPAMKLGYGPLHEARRHALYAYHHRRCASSVAFRRLLMRTRNLSRAQKAEALRSKMHAGKKTHRECRIFDFPF